MKTAEDTRDAELPISEVVKALLKAALWLLFLPLGALVFTACGEQRFHSELREWAQERGASADAEVPSPMAACSSDDAELAAALCPPWEAVWQFAVARDVAFVAIALGVLTLLWVIALSRRARGDASAQYASLRLAWLSLPWLTALIVLLQSALAPWLSFWVTALLLQRFSVKLVGMAVLLAAGAVFVVLRALWRKPPPLDLSIDGELINTERAAPLWQRLHALAARIGTQPPAHMVAGIDANFFVTEVPHKVGETELSGRILYVSLPLLRLLTNEEADAVLAHELAHLRHGDTSDTAKLAILLQRYAHYTEQLTENALCALPLSLLRVYRMLLELARSRHDRERELLADRVAAEQVGAPAVMRALVEIQAYASHRSEVFGELLAQQQTQEGELHLGAKIWHQLLEHTRTPAFQRALADERVAHPFDSHPPLEQRLAALGQPFAPERVPEIIAAPIDSSWVHSIQAADQLEMQQWRALEQRLSELHAELLLFRYLPANDEERALVEREYPPLQLADGKILLDCLSVQRGNKEKEVIALSEITEVEHRNTFSVHTLNLKVKKRVLPVSIYIGRGAAGKQALEQFVRYWQRARAAHEHQQELQARAAQGANE